MPDRLEEPPHDAVPALAQHHTVPAVRPSAATAFQGLHAALAVLEVDPVLQAGLLLGRDLASRPHRVLSIELETRVSEAIGEVTRGGEEEQSAGIEVETTDVEPAAAPSRRQIVKNTGAPRRIIAAHDLAVGFVIDQHPRQLGAPVAQFPPVEAHPIVRSDAGSERSRRAVHGEAAGADPVLHVASRAESERRQHLLQPLSRGGGGS